MYNDSYVLSKLHCFLLFRAYAFLISLRNREKLYLCQGFEPLSQAAERSHQSNLKIKADSKTFHPSHFEVIFLTV